MKASLTIAAASAALLLGGLAGAQEVEKISIEAKRELTTKVVGRTYAGVPIVDVSLSYGVSYAGLDLASASGAAELQKRVKDASRKACEEIGRQYPEATPGDVACTKATTDKAMVRVNELVAAAKAHK